MTLYAGLEPLNDRIPRVGTRRLLCPVAGYRSLKQETNVSNGNERFNRSRCITGPISDSNTNTIRRH